MEKVKSWKELTLREKIGQTVMCLCEVEQHIEMCGSTEEFLKKYPVGSIYNCCGMVKGLMMAPHPDFKQIVKEYNKYLRVPVVTASGGGTYASKLGSRLPTQMSMGACSDPQLWYDQAAYTSEDAIKTGIHWVMGPNTDIGLSKYSPVKNTRLVSDEWEKVAEFHKQSLRAYEDKKVISCVKHFPGGSHNEDTDGHLTAYDNEIPMDMWYDTYGKLYKELLKEKVPSIMTTHHNLRNYQTKQIDGEYPGATWSYELVTKLLREELGYDGVVLTDALVMGGFGGEGGTEKCIQSFLAGNDVLMWPTYDYIDEMEKRILSGEIDEAILDAAVERIWNMKKEYGIIDEVEQVSEFEDERFFEIENQLSQKCLTLLNNYNDMLPLDKSKVKNVLIVGVTPDDWEYNNLCQFKEEFEKYGATVDMRRNIWTDDVTEAGKKYDLIFFALSRTVHRPIGPLDFWGDEATSIWASNCADKNKTVIVNLGTPYLYKYYKKTGYTYINTYAGNPKIIEAVVKAIFGDIEFEGKSPVKL